MLSCQPGIRLAAKSRPTIECTEQTRGTPSAAIVVCRVFSLRQCDGRAAPAQREGAIQQLSRARPRAVAHGGEIGNQADVPEQDREQQIADDRPEIPDQRAAPLRPERHRVGIGGEPIGIDRPAQMDDRHDAGDRDREQRHRFRETVDRAAPLLPRQQQHGRDQRAGVADPDPPDVVRDRHAPHDGGVDAPDPDSLVEQPADRAKEPEHERQAGEQGEPPDACRRAETPARRQPA